MKEFGIRVPIMGNGVWLLMPETVAALGKDLIDNVMSTVAAHRHGPGPPVSAADLVQYVVPACSSAASTR